MGLLSHAGGRIRTDDGYETRPALQAGEDSLSSTTGSDETAYHDRQSLHTVE